MSAGIRTVRSNRATRRERASRRSRRSARDGASIEVGRPTGIPAERNICMAEVAGNGLFAVLCRPGITEAECVAITTGALSLSISRLGSAPILTWRIDQADGTSLVYRSTFHMGLRPSGLRKIPGRIRGGFRVDLVAQDGFGICRAIRSFYLVAKIADTLARIMNVQIAEACSADWTADSHLQLMWLLADAVID